jgi:hypothetical protein
MKRVFLPLVLIPLVAACYEDKGNYSYDESVNVVSVNIGKAYIEYLKDTTYVIRPEITQSIAGDKSNLRFTWRASTFNDRELSNPTAGDTLSRADTVAFRVNPDDADITFAYWLHFYVRDTITDTEVMFPLTFNLMRPYETAWMVLHREGSTTRLGSVVYKGDEMIVTPDAYFKERGEHLRGNPVSLGVACMIVDSYWKLNVLAALYVFTDDPAESGLLAQNKRFSLFGNMERIIYGPDYVAWNPAKATTVAGGYLGAIIVNDGKTYQGSYWGPRMYAIEPASTVTGPYYISHIGSGSYTKIAFDKIGRRFFYEGGGGNRMYYVDDTPGSEWSWVNSASERKDVWNTIPATYSLGYDLNDVGADKEMVYIGPGASTQIYALMNSTAKEESYVYNFSSYYSLVAVDTITTPAGLTTETPCASSYDYNKILFYAVGNQIYRLDFATNQSHLVWTHPDGGARITTLQIARGESSGTRYASYGHSRQRTLGVVVELPGEQGELVVLQLNTAGAVDVDGTYPAVQRHEGFGTISDIVFI